MELTGKKVLVTGGAGFIGSHLVERLVQMDQDVVVIDNFQAGRLENLKGVMARIQLVEGDIRDRELVSKVVAGVNVIFHLAANASVPNSVEDPRYDFETNALGTFNLLEASIASQVEKFIYASTAAVYGHPVYTPIDEKHQLDPISPYGASKLAAE